MHTVLFYIPSQVTGCHRLPELQFFNYGWIKNEIEKSVHARSCHRGVLLRFGLRPGRAIPCTLDAATVAASSATGPQEWRQRHGAEGVGHIPGENQKLATAEKAGAGCQGLERGCGHSVC